MNKKVKILFYSGICCRNRLIQLKLLLGDSGAKLAGMLIQN